MRRPHEGIGAGRLGQVRRQSCCSRCGRRKPRVGVGAGCVNREDVSHSANGEEDLIGEADAWCERS